MSYPRCFCGGETVAQDAFGNGMCKEHSARSVRLCDKCHESIGLSSFQLDSGEPEPFRFCSKECWNEFETNYNYKTPKKRDAVNHPAHYNSGRFEVCEVIEDWKLGFHCGNAVKYVARAGKKDPAKHVEDLEKAIWYLNREIYLVKLAKGETDVVKPNDMMKARK